MKPKVQIIGKGVAPYPETIKTRFEMTDEELKEQDKSIAAFIARQPKPSWFRIKIAQVQEYWFYFFKARYYIERYQMCGADGPQKPHEENCEIRVVAWTKYLQAETAMPFTFSWQDKPKHHFNFIIAALTVRRIKKDHPEFEHALVTTGDYQFIEDVCNGPVKETNTK